MAWLRLVGSLKSQVSFAKEPYKRADILQKRLIISRSLLIVATTQLVLQLVGSLVGWGRRACAHMYISPTTYMYILNYAVATISRLPKNMGLFCKRALSKRLYSAKETYIVERRAYAHMNISPTAYMYIMSYANISSLSHTLQHTATHCNTLQHTAKHCRFHQLHTCTS